MSIDTGYFLTDPAQNPAVIPLGEYVTNTTTAAGGDAVYGSSAAAWSLTNQGTIAAISGHGVRFVDGGTIANFGTITSESSNAIDLGGASTSTITNDGSIENFTTGSAAIYVATGGIVTNAGGAIIASASTGISLGAAGTIDNFGTVASTAPTSLPFGVGAYLRNGGLITNEAGAIITALRTGVQLGGGTSATRATIVNHAGIYGATGIMVSPADTGNNTIVNYGVITGTSGIAVGLGAGDDTLVIRAGSTLVGAIGGFHPGDRLDLPFMTFSYGARGASLGADNVLQVNVGTGGYLIALDPNQNLAGYAFTLSPDATGGTLVGETAVLPGTVAFSGQDIGILGGGWTVQGAADFSGDGNADALWRDTNGDTELWPSEPGTTFFASQFLCNVPPVWSIAGTGDFNADGGADILWRDTSGDLDLWLAGPGMAGFGQVGFSGQSFGNVSPAWSIAGVADFNGDGKADILWHDQSGNLVLWNSAAGDGVSFSGQSLGLVSPDWSIQGAADFNGDGKADILWRDTSGNLDLWLSGQSGFTGQLLGNVPTDWNIAGVADFNGDRQADMLWRDQAGNTELWLSGRGGLAGQSLGNVSSDWSIVAAADFRGNDTADILWRNTVTSDTELWNSAPG